MVTKSILGISLSAILAVSLIAGASGQIPFVAADEEKNKLKAILFDLAGNKVGVAKYEEKNDESKLKVQIKDFVSNGVFVVLADSTQIGLIATNSDGEGKIKFEPSPVMVSEGDIISIEDEGGQVISGTFEEKPHDKGKNKDRDDDDDEDDE